MGCGPGRRAGFTISIALTKGFSVMCPKSMFTCPSLVTLNDFISPIWVPPVSATMSKLGRTVVPSIDTLKTRCPT